MTDQKDRLGDKLRDVERAREDQHFAEQDRKLIEKMRQSHGTTPDQAEREAAMMRCPKCGARLRSGQINEVSIDECPEGHGIWLDKGELERIAHRESEGFVAHWLRQTITK